jgi:serine/threonine-protein kinase
MGAVWRAHDPDLGHTLAIKVLLECHRGVPELEQRFREEAQITGQLQHPGIPPVHEIGTLSNGLPFLAMKLVKGRTLADLLKDRVALADDLARLLGIFAQVCQTLAYAHSRSVIHRDLKPANVMMGAFGEVQVMDWGLAKVLGNQGPASPESTETSTITTSRMGAAGLSSQAGTLLGTPAYMAPEQARGEIARLDERCDVFGLGAILCVLLTGQPPYQGANVGEVGDRAARGDLADAFARLNGCGADPKLVGLAKECLCPERDNRPRDARVVAGRVATYQAAVQERLKQAELQRAAAEAREQEAKATAAAERKARRRAIGLGAAVTALLGLWLGGVLWLRAEQARREALAEAAVEQVAALEEAGHWTQARAVLAQAQKLLGSSDRGELQGRLEKAKADLDMVEALDAARLSASTVVDGKLDVAGAEKAYERALRESGLGEVGDDVATVTGRIQASAVGLQVVAALDDWATRTKEPARRDWLLAVARRADHDTWRDELCDPKIWNDRATLQRLAAEAALDKLPVQSLTALALRLKAKGGDGIPLLRAAELRHRQDFWVHFDLGEALQKARQLEEAIGCYRAALALRPEATAALLNLGTALKDKGQIDEAITHYQQALDLDSKLALARYNLGTALIDKGRVDEAIAHLQQALVLDPNYAPAHHNLGSALSAMGRRDEAIACFRKALTIDPERAPTHIGLGVVLRAKGRLDEAIAHHKHALEIDPNYALAHSNLALTLTAKGRLDEAITHFQRAIHLESQLAQSHTGLGVALNAKGQRDQAIDQFLLAIQLDPKDVIAHNNLGAALRDKGRVDEAIAQYRYALEIDPKYANAYHNLGAALAAKGRVDEAIAQFKQAIRLEPKNAQAYTGLGIVLYAKGRVDEAIAQFKQAIRLEPKLAKAHGALGEVLLTQGYFQEAREALRTYLDLLPAPDSPERQLHSRMIQQCEEFLILEGRLPAVLRGNDQPPPAQRLRFADLCVLTKRFATATRLFTAALAEQPQLGDDRQAQHRYKAAGAAALTCTEQGKDAGKLTDMEKAGLRQQALDWLRAELAGWAKVSDRALVQRTLADWQQDADLATLREKNALAKLPEAERRNWEKLWADVESLLQRAREKEALPPPKGKP